MGDMKESLRNRFEDLNQGLSLFVQELKDQDHWDDTTIIIASDFARTITANGGEGSDHAWGGHYMLMGGKVDGGKMIGKYPSDITPTGDLHVGRGRIMPTTSWESVLTGICEHGSHYGRGARPLLAKSQEGVWCAERYVLGSLYG